MTQFRLTYQPLGGGVSVDRTVQAPTLDQAYEVAAVVIAEVHGMPGEHVAFDRAAKRLTVGAGYRSRRGSFTLDPVAA
ncbi:MAG: hypothetical protein Q7J32_12175 [Sphingomonadaceae bacterium]|nr:hypothetical protein [Sphingomonadaceae bacterium]